MSNFPYFFFVGFCFALLSSVLAQTTCPSGWTYFPRNRGGWCLRVFPGSYSWWEAAGRCQSQGARLSGISGDDPKFPDDPASNERKFIRESFTALNLPVGQPNVWLGARRKPECMYLQYGRGGVRCIPLIAFEWTDGFTDRVNGMKFADGEPNNIGGLEDCAAYRTDQNKMNDFDCSTTNNTQAYLCGREAT